MGISGLCIIWTRESRSPTDMREAGLKVDSIIISDVSQKKIFRSDANPDPFASTNSARRGHGLSIGSHLDDPLFRNDEKRVTDTFPTELGGRSGSSDAMSRDASPSERHRLSTSGAPNVSGLSLQRTKARRSNDTPTWTPLGLNSTSTGISSTPVGTWRVRTLMPSDAIFQKAT